MLPEYEHTYGLINDPGLALPPEHRDSRKRERDVQQVKTSPQERPVRLNAWSASGYCSRCQIRGQSMGRKFVLILLAGTMGSSYAQPVDLSVHRTVDLADIVVNLLPADGFRSMTWDYLANDPLVAWKTDQTSKTGSWTRREGLVRVTVGGKASQVLRQSWVELPWTVTLSTSDSPKFGPTRIDIKPGGSDTESTCFGDRFRGCAFTAAQVLASKGLKTTLLCHSEAANTTRRGYSVAAPGKRPSLLLYELNVGSGGESATLQIRPLSDMADACGPSN
jgi:hypothetical protein